ncbi:MAG: class I tRNA ligase family protein, partial [Candidatus Jacksonbacteria bacterium]|nr:class I tRNA ligase family protein [Candidatus Jacksonbacteria bacterium]MBT7338731.1 class I tRNA ligase family protein [Candidatus Jacksonbacteria bacterium]
WNISRFIITSVQKPKIITKTPKPTTLSDEWILSQLHFTIEKVTNHLEAFELSAAAETLREFTWNELADWYLEIAKIEKDPSHSPPVGGSDGAGKDDILLYILTSLLKLWHPFTPFVTERIWNELSGSTKKENLLIVESWPENKKHKPVTDFKTIQNIIIAIRTARAELHVEPSNIIDAVITAKPAQQKRITKNRNLFEKLARVTLSSKDYPQKGHVIQESDVTITLHVPVNKEKSKKEIEKLEKYITTLKNKLSNSSFVDNAPQPIVQKEQEKLAEAENALQKLKTLS